MNDTDDLTLYLVAESFLLDDMLKTLHSKVHEHWDDEDAIRLGLILYEVRLVNARAALEDLIKSLESM